LRISQVLQRITIWLIAAGLFAMPHAALAGIGPISPIVGSDVSLSFSYRIDLSRSRFELRDERNRLVACAGAKRGSGEGEVIVSTRDRLKPGNYTLKWSTPTLDGDKEQGSVSFEVGP
jgi:methionine-rich copper-binding protein CopC